jgi:hypothetical protein
VPTRNEHYRKYRAEWVSNDVHRTVKRWIAIVLHDTVDQILIVAVECSWPFLRLHYAGISFNEPKDDKSTSMVRKGENCFSECGFVIVGALQIKPVFDLTIESFLSINQQVG